MDRGPAVRDRAQYTSSDAEEHPNEDPNPKLCPRAPVRSWQGSASARACLINRRKRHQWEEKVFRRPFQKSFPKIRCL
jgi:hypothetical protein